MITIGISALLCLLLIGLIVAYQRWSADHKAHLRGLQLDAYVDTQTLRVHIPAGDAQFTLPAWSALVHVRSRVADFPMALRYDPKQVAGHPTSEVNGPFSNEEVLNALLEGSGLQWRQEGDAAIIFAIPDPLTAY